MEPDNLPPEVYLEILNGDREGEMFPITRKTVTIGRDAQCDLHLADPYVSRKHSQIVFRGDHFTMMDLGSLNKTRVKEKEYIQKNLKDGYLITLGKTQLRFLWPNAKAWLAEHGIEEEQEAADE
ncbi:MAG: FHA domain-containing protein [Spirochaetaceae bacterium]|nr:MAG: FHA domain-containing protein [Spirochaetaceae bacterium]